MKKRWRHSILAKPELILMIFPGLFLLILFCYVPMFNITIAFKDYNMFVGIQESEWVGFAHFQKLFQTPDFFRIMRNTLRISFFKIVFGFPMPIILALLLHEVKSTVFKRVTQNIYYLPHFISWVVVAGLCFDVFALEGILNDAIAAIGFEKIAFLTDPKYFTAMLVVSSVWKGAGYGSIIYLAALTGIDVQLYEAAKIDGAGKWKQLLYITLPELAQTIVVMFILGLAGVLNAGFDQIQLLLNPLVMDVGDVLDTYVYRLGMGQAEYDFSTAVGLFKSVVNMLFVLTGNYLANKIRGEGIW